MRPRVRIMITRPSVLSVWTTDHVPKSTGIKIAPANASRTRRTAMTKQKPSRMRPLSESRKTPIAMTLGNNITWQGSGFADTQLPGPRSSVRRDGIRSWADRSGTCQMDVPVRWLRPMTSTPPDSEERRGPMSRRVAYAEEKEPTGGIDRAPRGRRLAPMRRRYEQAWFGGGQGS